MRRQWSILVSGSLLTAAAYLTNEDTELYADKLGAGSFWRRTSVPSQKEMVDAKRLELMKVRSLLLFLWAIFERRGGRRSGGKGGR